MKRFAVFAQSGQCATDMSDPIELAADTTKQIMTLSTAIITVGFAFVKDIQSHYTGKRVFLISSVILHLFSCGFGIWALLAITGITNDLASHPEGIFRFSVTLPSLLQIVCFFLGLIAMCLVVLGVKKRD